VEFFSFLFSLTNSKSSMLEPSATNPGIPSLTSKSGVDSHLSSPIGIHLSVMDQANPLAHLKSQPASPNSIARHLSEDTLSPDPPPSPLSQSTEVERIRLQMMKSQITQFRQAESRRPEYFKRAKRPLPESDPFVSEEGGTADRGRVPSAIGITASPNKGRRLKLFQETSEESFEESLMAGGYGRYVSLMIVILSSRLKIKTISKRQTGYNTHCLLQAPPVNPVLSHYWKMRQCPVSRNGRK